MYSMAWLMILAILYFPTISEPYSSIVVLSTLILLLLTKSFLLVFAV